ncbi:MAG: NfeD family protein [Saccharospirillum sp.]|nr:NfeD family protein [Saccharospirillum sp.]
MSAALVWIIIGIVLILSELMATSIVAVFIGIGAIVTGVLLHFGLIDSLAMQLIVFGVTSLGSLIIARKRFKQMFGGFSMDQGEEHTKFRKDLGERVVVEKDFINGAGRVRLNGVEWDALSDDDLKTGDVAWVIANEGIRLSVVKERPTDVISQHKETP